ncbi:Prepilin peptidase PppA [Campylobacter majalis]|uniref:Prepilin peptidase PppA n=2 Tax=Campylobacter majalis TaxID=2790656 RepID=A0ABM8Q8U4_9BACT|nr:A24 family peptidase [Campylobacter majalis]CAD7289210.1 Prepilin peptidase PppA [Campylobacter majalis]
MSALEIFNCSIFFILGLCMGSFSNVLIYRLPRNKSIVFPASSCINCKKKLKFYHNIPILSWIFLSGKCAYCNKKISIIYPASEIICAFIMVSIACKSTHFFTPNLNEVIEIALLGLLFITLYSLSVIDIQYKAVPEILLNIGIVLSTAYAITNNVWQEIPFYHNVLAGVVFAFAFWMLRLMVSKALKREAMGVADIFIAYVIGAILGYALGLVAIYIAAVLTLPFYAVIGRKNYELAFVPFLSVSLYLVFIFEKYFAIALGYLL